MSTECEQKTARDWYALGCIFSNPNATTVEGLGTHNRVNPTTSCEVTCPDTGGEFVVSPKSGA